MNKLNVVRLSSCLLIGSLALLSQVDRPSNALEVCASGADCKTKASNPVCKQDDRTPFNLDANTRSPHKVQLSWEVCQKSEFYQVSWSQFGGAETVAKVEGATILSWTLTRVRDDAKLTFKVRGCNDRPSAEPDCTTWTTLAVKAPDWD